LIYHPHSQKSFGVANAVSGIGIRLGINLTTSEIGMKQNVKCFLKEIRITKSTDIQKQMIFAVEQKGGKMADAITKIGLGLLLTGFAVAMIGLVVMFIGYAISEIF